MRLETIAWISLLAGCTGEATLVLAVRTDLVPQREFESVMVVLEARDGGPERRFALAAGDARDWGAGARVVEALLPHGGYAARVRALGADGGTVVERPVRFELTGDGVRAVTVWLTRDCLGVACPLGGDSSSLDACFAGRCVEGGCTEEDTEACGPPACASAAECGPAPAGACAARECTPSGACVEALDHGACGLGEVCDPGLGCVDAGPPALSPPSSGHAHLIAKRGTFEVYRLELREGAPFEALSQALETSLPTTGTNGDTSAGLSHNGEWLSLVGHRGGCDGCLVVAPVRDLTAAEVVPTGPLNTNGGTAITGDGRTALFVDSSGEVSAARRGAGTWTLDTLTADSPYVNYRPSLTLDERRATFVCASASDSGLCEVGLDGVGFAVRMSPRPGRADYVRELPDGSLIFQSDEGTGGVNLWRLPAGSSEPVEAIAGAPILRSPCALPDGRLLAVDETLSLLLLGADGRPTATWPVEVTTVGDLFSDGCGL